MQFKPRLSAVLQPQRTAGNRKYTAKTVKETYGPQSKRKPSATFLVSRPTVAFPSVNDNIVEPQRSASAASTAQVAYESGIIRQIERDA